jgi:hypothetical protein
MARNVMAQMNDIGHGLYISCDQRGVQSLSMAESGRNERGWPVHRIRSSLPGMCSTLVVSRRWKREIESAYI